MSLEIFTITDENPNDNCGGSGCLCAEDGVPSCVGPYVVFHGVDMFSPYSPHAVLGKACLDRAVIRVQEWEDDKSSSAVNSTAVEVDEVDPDTIADLEGMDEIPDV